MGNAKLISFIARGKRRLNTLELLKENEKSQKEIMKKTEMYKSHTSRTLKELSERKLIKCTNPKDRDFRFYKITKKGKEILEEAQKLIRA